MHASSDHHRHAAFKEFCRGLDLFRTGKLLTVTTNKAALDGADLDAVLKDLNITRRPDYTLSGEIIQDVVRGGNKTQNTYVFQMSLNSFTQRVKVWQGEEPIIW
jgi:hypothetical protein